MTPSDNIFTNDTIVVQQTSAVVANDFDLLDPQGTLLGRVIGQDSMGAFLFAGPRDFSVSSAEGKPLLRLVDVPDFGCDTFEVTWPDGRRLATLQKRFSLFSTAIDAVAYDGSPIELRGAFADVDYQIAAGGEVIGTVSRAWAGLGAALLGHSRYVVVLHPGTPAQTRLLALGTAIALDLIRRKRRRSNAG